MHIFEFVSLVLDMRRRYHALEIEGVFLYLKRKELWKNDYRATAEKGPVNGKQQTCPERKAEIVGSTESARTGVYYYCRF